jgi:type IV pilus assembly protein PilB
MYNFPRINLAEITVDKKIAALIPHHLAERHTIIPIKTEDRKIILAMTEPVDFHALEDVRLVSGYETEPVIAAEEDILRAIQKSYGVNYLAEKAAKEITQLKTESLVAMEAANDAPIISAVNSIISQAVKNRASDIHIEPQEDSLRVRFRIDGVLQETAMFPASIGAAVISRIKIMSELNIAEKRLPQDGRIVVSEQIDLRVSTLPTIFGEKALMRILDKKSTLLDIESLGFSAENLNRYKEFYSRAYGMVLITGPTGSGKTTTLYSTLDKINSTDRNIVTIEDPVEYRIPGSNQIQINPKAGLTFSSGLRSILRQDPDVIMVGEIRDGETADIAIRAALTGHLVFSTLHTNDAPGALNRLLDMGVEPYLASSALIGVVAQRLVRRICPRCKESYSPDASSQEGRFLSKMYPVDFKDFEKIILFRGAGCAYCNKSGYYGRIAIQEVMPLSPAIIEAVNRRADNSAIAAIATQEGMQTKIRDGVEKAFQGMTTLAEVIRVAI